MVPVSVMGLGKEMGTNVFDQKSEFVQNFFSAFVNCWMKSDVYTPKKLSFGFGYWVGYICIKTQPKFQKYLNPNQKFFWVKSLNEILYQTLIENTFWESILQIYKMAKWSGLNHFTFTLVSKWRLKFYTIFILLPMYFTNWNNFRK